MNITPLTFRTPKLNHVQTKNGRFYRLPDKRQVPGVTTVLEIINRPALVHWSANEERKHCLEIATRTFTSLTGEGGAAAFMTAENFRALLAENLGKSKAHYRVMKKAQDIGTEAHAAVEWHIRQLLGQSVGPRPRISDQAEVAVMAVEDWMKSVDFQPLAVEIVVYDPWQGYAGTIDWVAWVRRVLTIGDWKTGKAIYKESSLQNAAYLSALRKQCRLGDTPIQGCIIRLPKELEKVTQKPFEEKFITEKESRNDYITFLKALDLFNRYHQLAEPEPDAHAEAPRPVKSWMRKPLVRSPIPAGR